MYGRAYGLGALSAVPENADLNGYLDYGVYAVRTGAVASTIKNIPNATAGRLIVSNATGQYESQTSQYRYIEQKFVPYRYASVASDLPVYLRYVWKSPGTDWTYEPWFNEALKAYPVGSIHIRYDTQNPANIFGGTWTQITARVLRAGSSGSIGAEGGLADGSARTYIDVAVWRRTA